MGSELARKSGPQPINTWLESLKPSVPSATDEAERVEIANKDEAILLLLGKLALVYWRPDFQPGQAKQLYLQYVDDLREFPLSEIVAAVETYRRDGGNRFFPTPGDLRAIICTPPSWDVISKAAHLRALHDRARDEMASAVSETRVRIGAAPQARLAAE